MPCIHSVTRKKLHFAEDVMSQQTERDGKDNHTGYENNDQGDRVTCEQGAEEEAEEENKDDVNNVYEDGIFDNREEEDDKDGQCDAEGM